ncbi:MAG: GntR family transcriptional regulator [Candidatus Bipolaricaulia bacterium]
MAKLNKESLAGQIRKELRKRIVNLEIEQGEKIDVSGLEEEFGVSRAPVREALQSLVDQGLVEVKPRVGYFAVQLTPNQIKDICEMRKLLETYALSKSIYQIPCSKLETIRDKSIKLKDADLPHRELRSKFDETDEDLHRTIIKKSDNELLKEFTGRIHNLISLTRHLNERILAAIDEHLRLIDAIMNEDMEKAKLTLQEHLDKVEQEVVANHKLKSSS